MGTHDFKYNKVPIFGRKTGNINTSMSADPKLALVPASRYHGGNSKGTTCVVDRDVTAYLVVDRVLRILTEQYGCRYVGYPGFNDFKVIF